MRIILGVIVILVLALAAKSSIFTVDRTEYVYLTEFGRHVATYDGADTAADAGLHFKWPWPIQTVQRLDRRLNYFDLPPTELLTHDAKAKTIDLTLNGEAYVCWSIADKETVDRFIRRMGSPDKARTILGDRINGELGALIGQMNMADLIQLPTNGSRTVDVNMEELRKRLLEKFQTMARDEYGIEITDIRLRRLNHPVKVRPAIFAHIRTEREGVASRYTLDGANEAKQIKSEAVKQASKITTEAEALSRRREGEADAEADSIRNETQRKDPQFYEFLKKLEAAKSVFGDGNTVLFLSTQRKMLDEMLKPPQLEQDKETTREGGKETEK